MASSKLAQGFTLIELVTVLLVLSILAVYAMSNWPGMTLNLGAQTEQLANDLRYTQALSMTSGKRYCLTISANTYQIVNSATATARSLASGNTTVTLGNNISFGTITPTGAVMFVFDGKGQPYSSTSTSCNATNAASATSLSAAASIPLTANGETRTLSITPTTGMTSIQ